MENVEGLIVLLVIIALFIGLIWWQYRICKGKDGKKLGLILPLVSLVFSLVTAGSFLALSAVKTVGTTTVYDDDGHHFHEEVIEETEIEGADDVWIGVIVCLLFCNIPTAIYFGEYAVITGRSQKEELAKTQIQDL